MNKQNVSKLLIHYDLKFSTFKYQNNFICYTRVFSNCSSLNVFIDLIKSISLFYKLLKLLEIFCQTRFFILNLSLKFFMKRVLALQ